MTVNYATSTRDAMLAAIEVDLSTAPKLEIWSGTKPTAAADADAGDGAKLASFTMPSDWAAAPGDGGGGLRSIAMQGGTIASTGLANGTATHWRFKTNGATVTKQQGNITGDGLVISNTTIASGQAVSLVSFAITLAGG